MPLHRPAIARLACLTFFLSWLPAPLLMAADPDQAVASPWQNKIETLQYWTPERMREAHYIDNGEGDIPAELPPITPGGDIGGHAESTKPYRQDFVTRVTGELFFYDRVNRWNRHCSASVIESQSQRLVMTAAHCVMAATAQAPLQWNNHLMFVPAYDGNRAIDDEQRAPYGLWPVSRAYISEILTETPGLVGSAAYDLALVGLFDGLPGERIETVVGGGLKPRVNAPPETFPLVKIVGYPAVGPYDGATQYWCLSTTSEALDLRPRNCRTRFGHSGGPVIHVDALNPAKNAMNIVAVVHGVGNSRVKPVLYDNLAALANDDHRCNTVPCPAKQHKP